MTKLPNQRLLSERINQGIQQIGKNEELAVILLHINGFKDINYKYGTFNANSVLAQFAEKLKSILLEPYLLQAYMGMNMVARLQGAEFAFLLPRLRKTHNFEQVLDKLVEDTCASIMIDGNTINITTTAGIALYPTHGKDDETLIRHANFSLFHAEKNGLPYAIYQGDMASKMGDDQLKMKELNKALDDGEINLLYDPVVSLNNDKVIGVEAVVVFDDPERGLLTTEKLIPQIQGTEFIKKLNHFMITRAIEQLALWHQSNHPIFMRVGVFDLNDGDLPQLIDSALLKAKISHEHLKIEVTEKICLSDQKNSLHIMKKLSELGVKIVISDFCSGYTSFTYLTNFPINEVKIDKSFISNMIKDPKKMSVVKAVLPLTEAMNIQPFADGIADEKTYCKLKELGYQYGQGSFISQPIRPAEVTGLLLKQS